MVLKQPPTLRPKSCHRPPNAPQVANRVILATDEVVNAKPLLFLTMLSFPLKATKVCVRVFFFKER